MLFPKTFKYITIVSLFISLMLIPFSNVLAVEPPAIPWGAVCSNLSITGEGGFGPKVTHLSPIQILCPVVSILNVAIYAAGVVFMVMVVYGGIKLSIAFGDPKAFAAAKSTWVWAFAGFGLIIGSISLLFIVTNMFGVPFDILRPVDGMAWSLAQIMCVAGITDNL